MQEELELKFKKVVPLMRVGLVVTLAVILKVWYDMLTAEEVNRLGGWLIVITTMVTYTIVTSVFIMKASDMREKVQEAMLMDYGTDEHERVCQKELQNMKVVTNSMFLVILLSVSSLIISQYLV